MYEELREFLNQPITEAESQKARQQAKADDRKRKRLIREEYRLKMLYKTQGFI